MASDPIAILNGLVDLKNKTTTDLSPKDIKDVNVDAIKEQQKTLYLNDDALNRSLDLEDFIKNNRADVEKSTGPVIGRTPQIGLDLLADIDPSYNVAKQTKKKILEILNPYRHAITGAQASEQEIENFIKPLMPAMTDSYGNMFRNTREHQYGTVNQILETIDRLKAMGFDAEKNLSPKTKAFIEKYKSFEPDLKSVYFGQKFQDDVEKQQNTIPNLKNINIQADETQPPVLTNNGMR